MKIRKVRQIDTITITAPVNIDRIYVGKTFEITTILDEGDEILVFKDWLKGGLKEIGMLSFERDSGWDMTMFTGAYTNSIEDTVIQKLQQKLSIFLGELNYPFENTSEIGLPYIEKKSKEEMDLVLYDEISRTEGVINITEFESEMTDDRVYRLKFKIETQGGISEWLSTET